MEQIEQVPKCGRRNCREDAVDYCEHYKYYHCEYHRYDFHKLFTNTEKNGQRTK